MIEWRETSAMAYSLQDLDLQLRRRRFPEQQSPLTQECICVCVIPRNSPYSDTTFI